MTAARVDALVAGVKAACGYRRAVRVPASMQEVLDLAAIVRDLVGGEQRAEALVLHQGPFFNGTESRCQCGHPVQSAEEWAAHVNQKLEDGAS